MTKAAAYTTCVICFLLMSLGCASQQVQLTALPGQEQIVRDGKPALVSRKKHFVMLRPNSKMIKSNSRPAFTLVVRNLGVNPANLLISNIQVRQQINGKQHAVRLYSYEELHSEEKTRQAIAAVGAALSGASRAMSASNAGQVNTAGSFNAYGSHGYSHGTYSATTYDPLRAQLAQQSAQAATNAEFATLKIEGERNLSRLQQTILKDNTVLAGEWVGGTIVIDQPKNSSNSTASYSIVVGFGGEQHEFLISHVPS